MNNEIIMSEQEIKETVARLARQFDELYKDQKMPPIFIGVMKGAVPFMMDLIREMTIPVQMDFIQVSSYLGTETTGIIQLKKDISLNIKDRDVMIVEDIIDSGYTLEWLVKYLNATYKPRSVKTVALIDKKCKRKNTYNTDYYGKQINDLFIVGYGLDYNEFFRSEREIFVINKEQLEWVDSLTKKNK